MLVTREYLGNVSSTLEILVGSPSTPYYAQSGVRRSLASALSAGLEGVMERVADYSVDNNGA